jgi:hypothetical protein
MTNAELIAKLQNLPQDAQVTIEGYTGAHSVTEDTVRFNNHTVVFRTVVDLKLRPRLYR